MTEGDSSIKTSHFNKTKDAFLYLADKLNHYDIVWTLMWHETWTHHDSLDLYLCDALLIQNKRRSVTAELAQSMFHTIHFFSSLKEKSQEIEQSSRL